MLAGSGYWEHENVKQTWKTKPLLILIFTIQAPFPKAAEYCMGMVYLHYKLSITGPFWLCAKGQV